MRGKTGWPASAWFLNASETWENEEMLGHHELSELVLLFCELGSSKLLFLAGRARRWLASVLPLASIGRDELVRSAGTGETQSRRRRRGDGGQTAWRGARPYLIPKVAWNLARRRRGTVDTSEMS